MPRDARSRTPEQMGCCGIHAIATATGLPFATVFEAARHALRKRSTWQGATDRPERNLILDRLGATYTRVFPYDGLTVLEAAWANSLRGTDDRLIAETPHHLQVIRGGNVIDQGYNGHALYYRFRFSTIKAVFLVEPLVTEGGTDLI